ncbi:MAG: hypothetical protein M1815_005476 [Lichina confinis]|nr:MAG: hypothetical protein M1815_005476 [Lichina confinis]
MVLGYWWHRQQHCSFGLSPFEHKHENMIGGEQWRALAAVATEPRVVNGNPQTVAVCLGSNDNWHVSVGASASVWPKGSWLLERSQKLRYDTPTPAGRAIIDSIVRQYEAAPEKQQTTTNVKPGCLTLFLRTGLGSLNGRPSWRQLLPLRRRWPSPDVVDASSALDTPGQRPGATEPDRFDDRLFPGGACAENHMYLGCLEEEHAELVLQGV